MSEIILIAAIAQTNGVIGDRGQLPWSIPEDLKRFRQLTLHHTVIMGRKTWEFDLRKRPLPDRRNIIISSQSLQADGVEFVRSLSQALECTDAKRFIIGGASIYRQALAVVDRMELTIVEGNYSGDVFFCEWRDRLSDFELLNLDQQDGYRFETYQRLVPT
ncbi:MULTISPECIES: dihydrofolate reductase [Leptolyngbya]|uniref:dihydrofolate reductase n=1 Tax=Leptolyngbya TaxID=47251 RepID=UPI001687C3D4|nr:MULTISPECIES: dihydrofolate reductase [unclassified Leptolyngbya]MBD1859480.1 dihydrofolate reductase [Leptolyngbya sp. FACHB-1624]MBN8559173.1 dihydrofolate reductase [Leptolyngbya sp. UWPOB_LEPTO1]